MFLNYLLYILIFCLVSFCWCLLGTLSAYFFQGLAMAKELFISYVIHFNGILIFGFGYGLLWFIKNTYNNAFNNLLNVLDLKPEHELAIHKSFLRVKEPMRNHVLSLLITIIGGIILWNCGYPLSGFSKYFLAVSSISLFYVGGRMFSYLIWTIFLFKKMDLLNKEIKIQKNVSLMEFENLNSYLSIIFLGGIVALYLSFRGTLSANFSYDIDKNFKSLLSYPIILFLPFVVFSVFYIRYVLKKIQEKQIYDRIQGFNNLIAAQSKDMNLKESLDLEKVVLEIKEKLLSQVSNLNFIRLKDSPSIIIAILLLMQFIYQNDQVIKLFIDSLFKTN